MSLPLWPSQFLNHSSWMNFLVPDMFAIPDFFICSSNKGIHEVWHHLERSGVRRRRRRYKNVVWCWQHWEGTAVDCPIVADTTTTEATHNGCCCLGEEIRMWSTTREVIWWIVFNIITRRKFVVNKIGAVVDRRAVTVNICVATVKVVTVGVSWCVYCYGILGDEFSVWC